MSTTATTLDRIAVGLAKIDAETLGYPPTENFVRPPLPRTEVLAALAKLPEAFRSPLRGLYLECNGIEAMDVHNGYYIRPIADVVVPRDRYEPFSLRSTSKLVRVFAGDGGGNMFALNEDGAVLYLCHGSIEAHVYDDDDDDETCRRVANSIEGFVERVCDDVEAFVCGDGAWSYMIGPVR